jgi:alpha-D-ribose 1-methylphosphonate 5-phosphate C-P lyase
MNKRSRSFILNKVPDIYTKNAVVFNVPKPELLRRLKKREMETGKSIPLHVVDSFIDSYEKPTNSEFDNIIYN